MPESAEIIDAEIVRPDDAELAAAAAIEEAEYDDILRNLAINFPAIPTSEIDFKKLLGPRRTKKAIVTYLALKAGWSPADISNATDIPLPKVFELLHDSIQDQITEWDIEVLRTYELMELEAIKRDTIECRERNKENEVTVTETETEEGIERKTTTKGQAGNPAWNKVLLEISKAKRAVLGLDRPTKVQVDKTNKSMVISEIIVRTREEVEALKASGLLK